MKNDFKSFLAVEFSNYLQLLLSAGRSTRNHEIMLRSLDSFLLQNHTFEKCLSESIINQWLSTICGTSANKVSYIARYRGLSKYLRSINTVSYTHLDVYKRQPSKFWRMEFSIALRQAMFALWLSRQRGSSFRSRASAAEYG